MLVFLSCRILAFSRNLESKTNISRSCVCQKQEQCRCLPREASCTFCGVARRYICVYQLHKLKSLSTFAVTNSVSVVKLLSKLFQRCGSAIKHKVGIVFCRSSPVTKRLLTWGNLMLLLMLTSARCAKTCALAIVVDIRGQSIS